MEHTITIKTKLNLNAYEMEMLALTMCKYRDACNYLSKYIYRTHNLNKFEVQKQTYYYIRDIFNLPAQITISCIRTVIAKYKTTLSTQNKWIMPVFKSPQLELLWNRDYSYIKAKKLISINTIYKRIKVPFQYYDKDNYFNNSKYKFGTAKLINKHNQYYLHIPITYDVEECSITNINNVVGIDRGIRFLAASYDSTNISKFYSGNKVKQKRSHYKALRKELQKVGTPSSRRRLKAIGQRENRWMNDVNHCLSKALVENNPEGTLFVLEDLAGIRSATEKVRVKDRYVMVSWSYYDLEQKLIYKAQEHKQKVIKVNPAYTSQTCPKCGHIEKANRNKKLHLFCCKNCGYRSNDDRIGAMNLYRMGIEYLVESQTSTSDL